MPKLNISANKLPTIMPSNTSRNIFIILTIYASALQVNYSSLKKGASAIPASWH